MYIHRGKITWEHIAQPYAVAAQERGLRQSQAYPCFTQPLDLGVKKFVLQSHIVCGVCSSCPSDLIQPPTFQNSQGSRIQECDKEWWSDGRDRLFLLLSSVLSVAVTHRGSCVKLCVSLSNGFSVLTPESDLSKSGQDLPLQASQWMLWWPALTCLHVF